MPVTSIDENGDFPLWKCNIRFARSLFPMQSITSDAIGPKGFSELDFGLGILALIGAHILAHYLIKRLWRTLISTIFFRNINCHLTKVETSIFRC